MSQKMNQKKKVQEFEMLQYAARHEEQEVYAYYSASKQGLSEEQVETSREKYGENIVKQGNGHSVIKRLIESFVNPFTVVLMVLALVSLFTDVILSPAGEKDPSAVLIITTLVLVSGILRFVQETRSGNAAAKLSEMIETTTCVERDGKREIPLDEVVAGDIVYLAAGDMIPADMRILHAKDLFISQSTLTGESEPVEKHAAKNEKEQPVLEMNNLAFMGTTVVSGSAYGIVAAVGNHTVLGEMAKTLTEKPPMTSFEKGVNSVSWILIRFMLVMVPIVLFVNGFTKGDWMAASLFAISIAVGLTPEMLPMIVTTSLAKGAVSMSRKKVIIKNLNAIQNLGAMDILCTDKTGTLTKDKVVLQYHLNLKGEEDHRVLRHAYLNSFYQTGLKNLMDIAIIERMKEVLKKAGENIEYQKVDEVPFDFDRRRMSVVVRDANGKQQMITKGAIEEMLNISTYVEYDGVVEPLTDEMKARILRKVDELNDEGMRVIAVSQKTNPSPVGAFSVADESDMVLIGYLAFLDPPKETTAAAIEALKNYGVAVKILTGDNEKVTCAICRQVGLPVGKILLGEDVEALSDKKLSKVLGRTTVFAKLSPSQKARVVTLLRENGHVVGYMGDGINDAAAMKVADVGISVDTAVDIAKESADIILLEKDLMVLEEGIIEGRKTYANMMKYIKMTASSNFGNMFSVLAASAFLPFLPMASIHLILLNMIYDISCTTIPWDHVDEDYLKKPRKWDASAVGKFMLWFGPTSSIFDITTYLLMYFVVAPMATGGLYYNQITDPAKQLLFIGIFQAGWFVESMWTQTLVIHLIRTEKIPFIKGHAAWSVTLLTFLGAGIATIIPFTAFGNALKLSVLPPAFFAWLLLTIILYMALVTVVKKIYVRKYGELL